MKLDGTILYCGDHSKSDLVHFWCIFSEPKTRKTPSECTQKGFLFKNSAERARFELAIPFWGTHAFQAGESEIRTRDTLLGYTRFPGVPLQPLEHLSNTYPGPFGQNRTAKVIIFSGSASTGGSIFPRGAIKSGCGRCNRGTLRGNG